MRHDHHCLLLPNLFDDEVSQYTQPRPNAYVDLFSRLGVLIDDNPGSAGRELREAVESSSQILVLLTSCFSEAQRMSRENEVKAYAEFIREFELAPEPLLLIKPHPRDAAEKITLLTSQLGSEFQRILVLDDPIAFYLPFEAFVTKYLLAQEDGSIRLPTQVACFSSACLALEYLLGVPCRLGFGVERIRRYFQPAYVDARLKQERDLTCALSEVRSRKVGQVPAASAGPLVTGAMLQ